MNITDTHCDTLYKLSDTGASFEKNDFDISLSKLPKGHSYTQFFACFIDPDYYAAPKHRCIQLINTFHKSVIGSGSVRMCRNIDDIKRGRADGKMCAFLSIEGGECIESLCDLDYYYSEGVRLIALVWNNNNKIASGILGGTDSGITPFGKTVIKRMNSLGIVCDVSHMSEKSFYDCLEITTLPPVASHSCSKALCSHPRNLTDEQFLEIKKLGGYVGINFYPLFLSENGEADINNILDHMEHFLTLGGEDIIGIGSDFDGVEYLPSGLSSVSDIDKLIDAMLKRGWAECLIKKIMSENIEKIIRFF